MYKYLTILAACFAFHGVAIAHGGGLDASGCHDTKKGGRHCHGENVGKYIPPTEEKRIEKLHRTTCKSVDAEGRKLRVDLYGKPCR